MMMDYALCVLSERPMTSNISTTHPHSPHTYMYTSSSSPFEDKLETDPLFSSATLLLSLTLFLSSLHPLSLSLLFLLLSVSNPFSLHSLSSPSLSPLHCEVLAYRITRGTPEGLYIPVLLSFSFFPDAVLLGCCSILGKKGLGTVKLCCLLQGSKYSPKIAAF